MTGSFAFEVAPEAAGERLDRFLASAAPEFSRTRLKALIEAGAVTVDDEPALDASRKLPSGARVTLAPPPAEDATAAPENIPLEVVFEDAWLIVIDKPAGLVVHPAPGHLAGTLVNALLAHCGDTLSGIGGVKRPGIVHRLDKDTSGLMVVAKTDAAHQGLAALFADHGREGSLVREYEALAWNGFSARSGIVDAPLGRHPHSRERMAVDPRGRHAVTHWQIEEPLGPVGRVRCRLETGRTHQIRVHLAHIGCPLLGDPVYGSGFRTKANLLPEPARAALAEFRRQALHAATLGFEHPVTGEALLFEREPPMDFLNLAAALRV